MGTKLILYGSEMVECNGNNYKSIIYNLRFVSNDLTFPTEDNALLCLRKSDDKYVFRLKENATTWDSLPWGEQPNYLHYLNTYGNYIFKQMTNVNYSGFYFSKDYGQTWITRNKRIENLVITPRKFFVQFSDSLLFSNDFGQSWLPICPDNPCNPYSEHYFIDKSQSGKTIILTPNYNYNNISPSRYYTYLSKDWGDTWTKLDILNDDEVYNKKNYNLGGMFFLTDTKIFVSAKNKILVRNI
jgi:hypothetical protein